MATVCTRFAPSPTGFLHIGNARTALFAFLFAHQQGGRFILRIDDTDRRRFSSEFLNDIFDSLQWLHLTWDQGPYYQSDNLDLYREKIEELLRTDKAYRCYCTSGELESKRKAALAAGRKPIYDRTCRSLPPPANSNKPFTVRFKAPLEGETVVTDLIKGNVLFQNQELDDLIILRSDGMPTYNFCSVVDDATMEITHIVRGDDHLANTPRQVLLFQSLDTPLPVFAHLPLIFGPDHTPLSKRHGVTSVRAYRESGYLPEALVNFLVRLGWSSGDQEIFTQEELITRFHLKDVGKSAGIFNADKLLWLNSHYIKERPLPRLAQEVEPFILQKGYTLNSESAWLEKMVATLQPRAKTLVGLVESAHFYLNSEISIDPKAQAKFLTPKIRPVLSGLKERLAQIQHWESGTIHGAFEEVMQEHHLGLGKIAQPVRVALTGGTASPGIFEVMDVLGRERTLFRLDHALTAII
ncbi:MAG: glutamate--tRNA ligase [Candidatus Binatia bacterium]